MRTDLVFIELTVAESGLTGLKGPRRALVRIEEIGSLEDLGGKIGNGSRCMVTLVEPEDTSVENESGEEAVRGRRVLFVCESYEQLRDVLASRSTVVHKTSEILSD